MSVREFSAWIMFLVFGVAGAGCLISILRTGFDSPPQPAVVASAPAVIASVVVLEIALAIFFPKQADARPDERERLIIARSGHWAGLVFLAAVLPALGHYVVHADGDAMFNVIVLGLFVSGLVEYGAQVVLFRR
ncbi:MAG: hypothetical protein ACKN9P_08715 [Phenylobacterium sp.]